MFVNGNPIIKAREMETSTVLWLLSCQEAEKKDSQPGWDIGEYNEMEGKGRVSYFLNCFNSFFFFWQETMFPARIVGDRACKQKSVGQAIIF